MKLLLQIFLSSLLIIPQIFPQSYKLVWSDEFNGSSLDRSKWSFEIGNGTNGWGNSELEYYTNRTQNCSEQNGILNITALKENYNGYNYTSARIKTQGRFSFKYGKVEAKMKLPFGQGMWPAFWMLGDNISQVGWPKCGEIDIMEMIGGQGRENTVHGSAHWGGDYTRKYSLSSGTFADSFHVYDITWTPSQIAWLVDGITYATLDITPSSLSAFQNNFFIILNLAVGGTWPGSPDNSTVFPQSLQVDYVRVYQDTSAFPGVSIVSPPNNSEFQPNSNITLKADASVQSGNITKVEFYQDAMKIGETFVSPYSMTWNNVLSGNYKIFCTVYTSTGRSSTSEPLNINVSGNAVTSPYGGTPANIPGTIEAENYDLGGQGNAYNDSDTLNSGGLYRPSDGVDIEACSDTGGGYDVGWINNNEWLVYTISVKDSGTYRIGARVSSNSTGGSFHFEIDNNDITGTVNVSSTGGWQNWITVLTKDFSLSAGIHKLKFFANSAGFNINKIYLYPPDAGPSINFIYPDGGEQFSPDSIVEIKWKSLKINTVNIGFSTNGGSFWSSVQNGIDARFGVYRWKIPNVNSSKCKLIIMSPDNILLMDTTRSVFSVGSVNSIEKRPGVPGGFFLEQNYPNPFNPSTAIDYGIPDESFVIIKIYDLLGKEIKTLVKQEKFGGDYHTVWNGKDFKGDDVPSGIYFYSLHAGKLQQVKKMILLR